MSGTFRPGDMLVVREVAFNAVRPGDVVAFRAPDEYAGDQLIVHRVLACAPEGLLTRGDACAGPDTVRVQVEDLMGRVIQMQRGVHTRTVPGGLTGRWWALVLRLRRLMMALARAPYRWLRASGFIRHLWHPRVTHVTLATMYGPVVKYLCGTRTVAAWYPETHTYWCQKPYDLVLRAPDVQANTSAALQPGLH
jgi:hypothetical protein